jgi:carboxyl-terminal processing protease
MRLRFGLALLAVAIGVAGCASRRADQSKAPMTAAEHALALQSFDKMWTIVRDRHFDPNLNGVDWEAVKTEVRPKVEAATTHDQTVALMNEALGRLGQSHFGIIPVDAYEGVTGGKDENDPTQKSTGEVGIDVRAIDGEAIVVAVDPGSPAEAAGIRPGWKILEIDGKRVSKPLAAIDKAFAGESKREGMLSHALGNMVTGNLGEQMTFRVADGDGTKKTLTLEVVETSGSAVVFGNLPAFHLEYDARTLPSGVAYLRFSVFFDPATLMPWFRERVVSFAGAPGLIIDLRGNPGGIGGMAMGMGNMLVDRPNQKLGTMTTRETSISFVLNPQVGRYAGPVAVLIDELSMSTSEILAGGLQAIGRARVFGVRTPGMALPSQVVKLPSGDGFQFATADYVSADGKVLEGHGVEPDQEVRQDVKALLEGRDVVIEAAEAWVRSQQNQTGG